MLLIDPRQTIASIPAHASLVPFIVRDFDGDALRIANDLLHAAPLERLIPVLLKELAETGHAPKLPVSLPMLILSQAAREIAQGTIKLGFMLPEKLDFRVGSSVEKHYGHALRFANARAAQDFVRRWSGVAEWQMAFAGALAHPRAAASQAPAGPDLVNWVATLFMTHKLGLFPIGSDLGCLRFAWISHQAMTKTQIAAPPPAPAASPVPQIVQSVASTLPDLPAEISAQAQTLIDAAQSGVPFCEECAKAAAALLGV